MGDVGIEIKIMASSPEIDLEQIKNKISEKLNVQDYRIEPLAFGLKALIVLIVVPDKSGKMDEIENTIKSIEGVESVEILNTSLI
ncbi:MAG: elongation factor 1-beta [Candidatus Aenigmarchaeota archaeon]|nr:elongation factor 1-beta [Candidatus Aenigmarchaeota archaeon]